MAVGGAVLRAADDTADISVELQREQIETGTVPCRDLADLDHEIRRSRRQLIEAADVVDVGIAALATSPLLADPTTSPAPRYRRMIEAFGLTGREQLTCGCHVHVGVGSDEEGVAVLDRIRPWIAPLLALSANSPFWQGTNTDYSSYRSQVWGRWPSAGPTGLFRTAPGYQEAVRAMLDTDTMLDEGMVYYDARLSHRHPTVEIRIADVCRDPDDTVLLAALVRGLVTTASAEWQAGRPPDPVRTEVLRLAAWRAGRSGLDDHLLDPSTWRPAPAAAVITRLVDHVSPALEDSGDLTLVRALATTILRRGTGAARQREVLHRTGDMRAVVTDAVIRHDSV